MGRRRTHWVLAIGALLSVACSSSGQDRSGTDPTESTLPDGLSESDLPEELLSDLTLLNPAEGDVVLFTDISRIEPGVDTTLCTYTDWILDEPLLFHNSFGSQSTFGHHAILTYTMEHQAPGTGPCTGDAMGLNFLLGGTGGKTASMEDKVPKEIATEVPAGAQFVINHHWINTSPDAADVQAMMVARPQPDDIDTVLAGRMIFMNLGWEVAPRSTLVDTKECTFARDMPFFRTFGHMHEWGTNVKIEVDRLDGTTEVLHDDVWDEDAATGDPPQNWYETDAPLVIRQGETARVTCEWNNTDDEPLTFPREMCIFIGNTLDGENAFCFNETFLEGEVPGGSVGH